MLMNYITGLFQLKFHKIWFTLIIESSSTVWTYSICSSIGSGLRLVSSIIVLKYYCYCYCSVLFHFHFLISHLSGDYRSSMQSYNAKYRFRIFSHFKVQIISAFECLVLCSAILLLPCPLSLFLWAIIFRRKTSTRTTTTTTKHI